MKNVNWKLSNKPLMVAFVSLLFVAAMAAMTIPTVKAPGLFAFLSIDPPSQTVNVDDDFIVNVDLNTSANITRIIFNLSFDPNLMQFITAHADPSIDYSQYKHILIDPGDVTFEINFTNGFTGIEPIVNIEFHCLEEGTSSVNFTYCVIYYIQTSGLEVFLSNGTVTQIIRPVGGEVLAIDALALLMPWIVITGAVAATTALVLTSKKFNH